jgi:hypothetical protein
LVFIWDGYSELSFIWIIAHAVRANNNLVGLASVCNENARLHSLRKNFTEDHETIGASHTCATLDDTFNTKGLFSDNACNSEYIHFLSTLHARKRHMSILIAL